MEMALAAEEQSDADFFDKLIDDEDLGNGSGSGAEMVRGFSNLSLSDDGASLEDSDLTLPETAPAELPVPQPIQSSSVPVPSEVLREEAVPVTGAVERSAESKGTSVKQVQWSAFGAKEQQVGHKGSEPFSDFLVDEVPFGGPEESKFGTSDGYSVDSLEGGNDFFGAKNNLAGDVNEPFAAGQASNLGDEQGSENMYPGWQYDAATGQYYQLDSFNVDSQSSGNEYPGWQYDASTGQYYKLDNFITSTNAQLDASSFALENTSSEYSNTYLQNPTQGVVKTIEDAGVTGSVSNWNQDVQSSTVYPPNMVFDPQFPGWFYDTIAQQWFELSSYAVTSYTTSSMGQDTSAHEPASDIFAIQNHSAGETGSRSIQSPGSQEIQGDWNSYGSSYSQKSLQEPTVSGMNGFHVKSTRNNHLSGSFYGSTYAANQGNQQQEASYKAFEPSPGRTNHSGFQPTSFNTFQPSKTQKYGVANGTVRSNSFISGDALFPQKVHGELTLEDHLSNSVYNDQSQTGFKQSSFLVPSGSYAQVSYTHHEGRSSAGRPPHALVSFGFGGKMVVMKESSSYNTNLDNGKQGASGCTLAVVNLFELVADRVDTSAAYNGSALSYLDALCRHPIPGPLVGGNIATKDVNKWLDEKAGLYENSADLQRVDNQKLLFSLLKILCQHYGKLRSPFRQDPSQEEADSQEIAVTKLFSSAKGNSIPHGSYSSSVNCMKNLPSESQLQATAQEVQNLLVTGKRKEALQCAQEGQLWGPALVLASQLGDKFYVDTVKKMAQGHFVSGSPLKTLCLLIAGQPADVFSVENPVSPSFGSFGATQQPVQFPSSGMLDNWQENLAIITANRTKGDELVITHLGDCLWKERGEVIAAHLCYLVAEREIESYSESARLCLIGADHWKGPRTFVNPEAIQRTEIYEYAKVLGNAQYILLPFQPYKLVYAYMLAEVGKVSESLRYCQASLKLLKSSGRAPELDACKLFLSSLEERIRAHQQGGYGTGLAPAKFVGKFFKSMMGSPQPSLPPVPQSSGVDKDNKSSSTKAQNTQSFIAKPTMIPSASVESSINNMTTSNSGGKMAMHNRSVSEPDFLSSPRQNSSSKSAQGNTSSGSGSSGGWFGSRLLKMVLKPNHKEAKLGDENQFYYDEKLKRWVERGAEPPAEEPPLGPPPTSSMFPTLNKSVPSFSSNGPTPAETHSFNGFPEAKPPLPSEQSGSAGMPPMPRTHNQFSARRVGVRARYVDTFNKNSRAPAAGANLFQSPAVPSIRPAPGANFFVPTMPAAEENDEVVENNEIPAPEEPSSSAPSEASFSSHPPTIPLTAAMPSSSPSTIQRFPSMDNITPHGNKRSGATSASGGGPLSRPRAASWSGMASTFVESSPGHAQTGRNSSSSTEHPYGVVDDMQDIAF